MVFRIAVDMIFPISATKVAISVTLSSLEGVGETSSSCATAMSDPLLKKKMKKKSKAFEIVKEVIACDISPVVMFKN